MAAGMFVPSCRASWSAIFRNRRRWLPSILGSDLRAGVEEALYLAPARLRQHRGQRNERLLVVPDQRQYLFAKCPGTRWLGRTSGWDSVSSSATSCSISARVSAAHQGRARLEVPASQVSWTSTCPCIACVPYWPTARYVATAAPPSCPGWPRSTKPPGRETGRKGRRRTRPIW